jgi:hypothetical protein
MYKISFISFSRRNNFIFLLKKCSGEKGHQTFSVISAGETGRRCVLFDNEYDGDNLTGDKSQTGQQDQKQQRAAADSGKSDNAEERTQKSKNDSENKFCGGHHDLFLLI